MSVASNVIQFPLSPARSGRDALAGELAGAVAGADSAAAGMSRVVDRVRLESGAAGVEWWSAGEDGAVTRIVTAGTACGRRDVVSLSRAGALVIHGGRVDPALGSALDDLAPVIRRREIEEQLVRATASLARRNEALDDFAALVAHELKTPLQAALSAEDPAASIGQALELVDILLEAARADGAGAVSTDVGDSLDRALASLHSPPRVTRGLAAPVPMASGSLFVILRNLLANAGSAGASSVDVRTERSPGLRLVVDDDGAGLAEADRYATGSRVGLALSRQIAARSGAALELTERSPHGTRATLTFGVAGS